MITLFPVKGDISFNEEKKDQILMMSNTLKCQNFGILIGYMTGEVKLFSIDGTVSNYIFNLIS